MTDGEGDDLRTAIDRWLADGPIRVDELCDRAQASGLLPADEDDAWETLEGLFSTTEGYWRLDHDSPSETAVLASTFLDTGLTLTHRVTEAELVEGALVEDPDLEWLTSSVGGHFSSSIALHGGGELSSERPPSADGSRLVGPDGWLDDVTAGDLLAFTRRAETVEVAVVHDVGDDTAELEGLRSAAADWIPDGAGQDTYPLVMDALARDPSLFRRPCRPVGELLDAIGLEQRGPEWGRAGTAWQTRRERWADGGGTLQRNWGFDRCCNTAFDLVLAAERQAAEDRDLRAVSDALAHGTVLPALVDHHRILVGGNDRLVELGVAIGAELSGRRAAPGLALQGFVALSAGDARRSEELLDRAVVADADLDAARELLIALALDRGDLVRASNLVHHDLVDPDVRDLVIAERDRQAALRPAARRNDPCPCGSGRKFKQCCAHGGPLPLRDRIPLVTSRLVLFAASPEHASSRFSLALSAVVDDDVVKGLHAMMRDPFVTDVLIHEGGLADAYLEQRAGLLPEDEVELLVRILESDRRLWEVVEVDEGRSLTLRDTGAGGRVTVLERSGSVGRVAGDFLLARVVEADGETLLVGLPVVVPLSQRKRVLRMLDELDDLHDEETRAEAFVQWYGHLLAPLVLTNREGEALVLRRTELDYDDPDDVAQVLDRLYDRQGDDPVWNEHVDVGGDRVLRATIELGGDVLVVTSNSDERQDRVLDVLLDELSVSVVLDAVAGSDDLDRVGGEEEQRFGVDPPSPEVLEAMEKYLLDLERRWVDESIPALDGLTPRQAHDDPTRREDLDALLRELGDPDPDGPPMMSASRIRQLLGGTDAEPDHEA